MTDASEAERVARSWTTSGGTTITTNIPGFEPMGAEAMAGHLVAMGLMTQADADAALERRRKRRDAEASTILEQSHVD